MVRFHGRPSLMLGAGFPPPSIDAIRPRDDHQAFRASREQARHHSAQAREPLVSSKARHPT
jgi:hypothetical protein